jgi:hypothetical protein
LITLANARVWASEGWQVTITDAEGKEFDPAGFENVVAEVTPLLLREMQVPMPPEHAADQAAEVTDEAEAADHAFEDQGAEPAELIDAEDVIDEEDMRDEDVSLAPEEVA